MEKNSYSLKLQGRAEIPAPLTIGENYNVTADVTIIQESKNDNQDGTLDIIFKGEPMTIEINKNNGPVIKAKDPRRNSQKIRNKLFKVYTEEGRAEPFDKVYDAYTLEINSLASALLEGALKRLQ